MKNTILAIILFFASINVFYSQTNTYPSTGNVGIGTVSPRVPLHIENNGIESNGILLKLANNSNNFAYSGIDGLGFYLEQVADTPNKSQIRLQARNSNQGNYAQLFIDGANSRFNFINGNVGIGTSNPSNDQGWNRVLDVSGTNHSKILATSNNSNFRVGIFSHNEEWHGGGGFIGTESNHTLFLIAGYDPKMTVLTNGNIGIGTKTPTSKLTVAGNINSREVKVSVDAGADFVFEKDYTLPSLQEVEKFVTENKHLPEIASAKEMQKEGINLSEMNIKLLQKIEELTLYMIELNKLNNLIIKENNLLKENQTKLEKRIKNIEKK